MCIQRHCIPGILPKSIMNKKTGISISHYWLIHLQSVAASDTPIMHPTPACHPGSAKRYPGPIHPAGPTSQWFPALRYAPAGMTIIAPFEAAQPARSINPAPPLLRSSRRKSGPRASRVLRVTGLRKQPWIPAYAGMSGFLNPPNKNAAA